jgi:hypothetical protein
LVLLKIGIGMRSGIGSANGSGNGRGSEGRDVEVVFVVFIVSIKGSSGISAAVSVKKHIFLGFRIQIE